MQQIIDYRNAKYQGVINHDHQRQSLGILIDDDLVFYVSNWKRGLLSGPTMVYLAHGKYVYGQWDNNQPNGLNVFRMGDTVLLGVFKDGVIGGRTLVIFEKLNFIAVLENITDAKCTVIEKGQFHTIDDLKRYIALMLVDIPDHYLSLGKYLGCFKGNIKLIPSRYGSCFFGNEKGLGITFNCNNAILSLGKYSNNQIAQFGGVFQSGYSEQGNFEAKNTIQYQQTRPTNQIYAIYQKIHKKSLFFENSYFYSKIKVIKEVENILRGKIAEIADECRDHTITLADLNDSLDYQQPKPMEKDNRNKSKSYKKYTHSNDNIHKQSKSTTKNRYSYLNHQQPLNIKHPSNHKLAKNSLNQIRQSAIEATNYHQPQQTKVKSPIKKKHHLNQKSTKQLTPKTNYPQLVSNNNTNVKTIRNYNNHPIVHKTSQTINHHKQIQDQPSTMLSRKTNQYQPTKQHLKSYNATQKQSPYRIKTKYEDLNQRRQRLIHEFKNLKSEEQTKSVYEPLKQNQDSPFVRQKLYQYISKENDQNNNEFIPLTLTKQTNNQKDKKPKNNLYQKKNDQMSNNEIENIMGKVFEHKELKQKNQIYLSPFRRKNQQIIDNSDRRILQENNKNNEVLKYRNTQQQMTKSNSKTPTARKYQYYFD